MGGEWDDLIDGALLPVRRAQAKRRRLLWHSRLAFLSAALSFMIGLVLLAAPWLLQSYGDTATGREARRALETTASYPAGARDGITRDAVAYNQRLAASGQPMIGEPVFEQDGGGTGFQGDGEYRRTLDWDGQGTMGELHIPSISLDLPILHGATSEVLDHAAGHLPGTSLPVGGASTHAVLTGHTNLPDATLFTRIDELKPGDPFYLRVGGHTLAYRVTGSRIVKPTDTGLLRIVKGRDLVTLLTCTGEGNTMRLLVTGERAEMPLMAPYPTQAAPDAKRGFVWAGVACVGVVPPGFVLARRRNGWLSGRHANR
ncbi:class C sortase [Bifidobacterium sp. SO1]|uniref:class C sortase n=1 Tax=Bifidobacterium sp. SO1 TaxID=2809029 RepID=UPI001BDCDF9F|nr:class C sortase [Bifidobacterium sp. SO1]MBT1161806.1 class C sortase [Bifidobacterium sp. SO1]